MNRVNINDFDTTPLGADLGLDYEFDRQILLRGSYYSGWVTNINIDKLLLS